MKAKGTAILAGGATLLLSGLAAATLYKQADIQKDITSLSQTVTELQNANLTNQMHTEEMAVCIEQTKGLINELKAVKDMQEEAIHTHSELIAQIRKEIESINRNSCLAEEAWKKSQELKEAKDFNSALIYGINALSSNPSQIKYYANIANLAENISDADAARLEEILNILDAGMYKVQADQMPELSTLAESLRKRISSIRETKLAEAEQKQQKAEQELQNTLAEQWKKLETPGNYQEQITVCQQRLALLQQDNNETELKKTSSLLTYLIGANNIENAIQPIEQALNQNLFIEMDQLDIIAAKLQSAYAATINLMSHDLSAIPEAYPAQLKQFANRIRTCETKTDDRKARFMQQVFDCVYTDRIDILPESFKSQFNMFDEAIPLNGGELTTRLQLLSRKAAKLNALLPGITNNNMLLECKKKMNTLSGEIDNLQKARKAAYQMWAVDKCKDAIDFHENCNPFNDEDADSIMNHYKIYEIDVTLLTPESMEIYQYIRAKVIEEYNGTKAASAMKILALSQKKSIEEF